MGLGNRSLPSRAARTDPHVTFPVVTVSGCHSLMLSVEGLRMSGGKVAAPSPSPPPPALAFEDLTASPAGCSHRQRSSPLPCWKGEIHTPDPLSERPTFSPPQSALARLAALTV